MTHTNGYELASVDYDNLVCLYGNNLQL